MDNFLGLPFWFWRLLLAVALSGIVGLERQLRGRAAGLRTHILVCLGATLVTLAGVLLSDLAASTAPGRNPVYLDSTRIAAGVITGIGFLGAGAILRSGNIVRGLTTAASIWFTAGLGVIIGLGFFAVAVVATALALVTLLGLVYLEERIPPRHFRSLTVIGEGIRLPDFESACRQVLADSQIRIRDIEILTEPPTQKIRLVFHLQLSNLNLRGELVGRMGVLAGVREVVWKQLP
ncbi:MAG: MgtC/SapB family protein [Lentisphaerae bacterium]|nr:MgtC/SapB family protein [Lentisphaerota bacterium]